MHKNFKPLIDFRATSIFRSFILNAIVLAVITVTTIEFRTHLDVFSKTKNLKEWQKILLTLTGTFIFSFCIFTIIRIIFGYGDGNLASSLYKSLF